MHWAAKYVGLPYLPGGQTEEGLDCWGLLVLIYKKEFGIELPSIPSLSQISPIARRSLAGDKIEKDWTQVRAPFEGCLVAMSQQHVVHHVGIWVQGRTIHSWGKQHVISDSLRGLALKGIRSITYYQHKLWKPT